MSIKVSLYTRFTVTITALLLALVAVVLFFVQREMVQTVFDEARTNGVRWADYIISLNSRRLQLFDLDALQDYADEGVDERLPFIIFYDSSGKPVAATGAIQSFEGIYRRSHLEGEVRPESVHYEPLTLRIPGGTYRVLEVERPIYFPGSMTRWGSIKIGHSLEDMWTQVGRLRLVLVLIGLAGLGLGAAGSALLARRITGPLQKLVEGTVRIARGDFSHRIEARSADEIGELARSFNEMTSQLLRAREREDSAKRKLVQAEKLASIGRLAATIAHEIRNPLTSVKLNIQKVAENDRLDEIEREHLGISQEGIGQIEKFIKELLNYTRVPELNLERFSLEQIIDESFKLLQHTIAEKRIVVEKQLAAGLPAILVDGDKLRQVFLNVLRNACEAVAEGGRIAVTLDAAEDQGRPHCRVRIADDGPGIPDKDREAIFEPFYTTKSSGFGLGLANARKIVEQHHGTIRLAKRKGKGSTFVICLPCQERRP